MSETSPARFPVFGVMESSVLVALFCLALDFLHPTAPEDTPPDFGARGVTQDCTMTWNGLVRKYRIYIPKSYDAPDSKKAIWMGLHGSQGDQTEFYNYGWREKSDADGFVIVLPSAYPSPVNTGIWQFHGTDTFPSKGAPRGTDWMWKGATLPDDMGYLRRLLGFVQSGAKSDPGRIYVGGFSVGGCMAHRVGVELSDIVAAIACIEGVGVTTDVDMDCSPRAKAPVSVIAFHEQGGVGLSGHLDPGKRPGYSLASYDMFFDYWSGPKANNCSVKTPAPFTDAPYDGKVTMTLTRRATSGLAGTEVVCYALVGGGHSMYADTPMNDPKAAPYNPSCTASRPGVSENEMIGKFFDAHPKPSPGPKKK